MRIHTIIVYREDYKTWIDFHNEINKWKRAGWKVALYDSIKDGDGFCIIYQENLFLMEH